MEKAAFNNIWTATPNSTGDMKFLDQHMESAHPHVNDKRTEQSLEDNVSASHQESNEKIECSVCSENYDDITEYTHHLKVHLEDPAIHVDNANKCIETGIHDHHDSAINQGVLETKNMDELCPQVAASDGKVQDDFKTEPPFLLDDKDHGIKIKISSEHEIKTELLSQSEMKLESEEEVDSKLKLFPCFLCTETFTTKKSLNKHIELHKTEKGFACPQCDHERYFCTKMSVARHINTVHKKLKPFLCPTCGQSFARKTHLNSHFDTVHKNIKRISHPWTCALCGKHFACDRNMSRHMRSHTKEKPWRCTVSQCEKHFFTKDSMEKHVNSVHKKLRDQACEICEKLFSDNYKRKRHMDVVHKGLGHLYNYNHTVNNPTPCSFCDKLFLNSHLLKRHVDAVHHKLKPFSCTLCDRSFSTRAHLKRHISFHSSEKPFSCSLCQKHFYTKDCLKKHTKLVHKNVEPFSGKMCDTLLNDRQGFDHHPVHQFQTNLVTHDKLEISNHIVPQPQCGEIKAGRCLMCRSWFDESALVNHLWKCQIKLPCLNNIPEVQTKSTEDSSINQTDVTLKLDSSPHYDDEAPKGVIRDQAEWGHIGEEERNKI